MDDKDFPPLEKKCNWCSGTGYQHEGPCHSCCATGMRPTAFGYAVLEFINRNAKRLDFVEADQKRD